MIHIHLFLPSCCFTLDAITKRSPLITSVLWNYLTAFVQPHANRWHQLIGLISAPVYQFMKFPRVLTGSNKTWDNPSFARSNSSKIVLILIPLFERLTVKSNKCIYVRFICFNFPSRFEIESKKPDRFTESNLTQSQTRIKFEDKLVFKLKSLIKKEIILPILLTNSLINLYPLQFPFRMKQKKTQAALMHASARSFFTANTDLVQRSRTLSYPLVLGYRGNHRAGQINLSVSGV